MFPTGEYRCFASTLQEKTTMFKELTKKIEEINAQLRAFGREAVQEIKMVKNGKVIGGDAYKGAITDAIQKCMSLLECPVKLE